MTRGEGKNRNRRFTQMGADGRLEASRASLEERRSKSEREAQRASARLKERLSKSESRRATRAGLGVGVFPTPGEERIAPRSGVKAVFWACKPQGWGYF